jgi:hypothetical protein
MYLIYVTRMEAEEKDRETAILMAASLAVDEGVRAWVVGPDKENVVTFSPNSDVAQRTLDGGMRKKKSEEV